MDERRLWLEATPSVAFERCCDITPETLTQIQLDLARTFGPMLFRESWDEEALLRRREKVEELLIRWLQGHQNFAYMQGMNHMMAMCYREVEDDGALQIFDHMIRQVNEDLYHSDVVKLFETVQATAEQLRSLVKESRPDVAKKLTEEDVDFFPMIIQNWMIDSFISVLPPDAAAALWHHAILDNAPGLLLKFASRLLLSSSSKIMLCQAEDINEVLADIPKRIQSPEDVDSLLAKDWTAPAEAVEAVEAVPVQTVLEEIEEMGQPENWQVTLKLPAQPARARLPKRWQPWKFMTVAMIVPWLLIHATAVHEPRARGASRPPVLQQPCFKGHVKFVGVWV